MSIKKKISAVTNRLCEITREAIEGERGLRVVMTNEEWHIYLLPCGSYILYDISMAQFKSIRLIHKEKIRRYNKKNINIGGEYKGEDDFGRYMMIFSDVVCSM